MSQIELFKALQRIQGKVKNIAATEKVKNFRGELIYSYASLGDVVDYIRHICNEEKIGFMQLPITRYHGNEICAGTRTIIYQADTEGAVLEDEFVLPMSVLVEMYQLTLRDKEGNRNKNAGATSFYQFLGVGDTYIKRRALCSAFGVVAEEDTDGAVSMPASNPSYNAPPSYGSAAPRSPSSPASAPPYNRAPPQEGTADALASAARRKFLDVLMPKMTPYHKERLKQIMLDYQNQGSKCSEPKFLKSHWFLDAPLQQLSKDIEAFAQNPTAPPPHPGPEDDVPF